MIHEYYTSKRQKGKHLNYTERKYIEYLYKIAKLRPSQISKEIGVSARTIQREIKRGMVHGLKDTNWAEYSSYSSQVAEIRYQENQSKKEGNLKIGKNHELMTFLKDKLYNEKMSPYVALELAKRAGLDVCISERTLYNYIEKGLFLKYTRDDGCYKRRKKKSRNKKLKEIKLSKGKPISQRPQEINDRKELGHYEIDTVIGEKGTKACLLVLTERKTRYEKIKKLDDRKAESVYVKLREIIEKDGIEIKSLTSDNGVEFMCTNKIQSLGIEHYYAHSYASYERGSNENANRFIRRFIKKGKDIGRVSEEEIQEIENYINNYCRKMFNGKSSLEMMNEYKKK